LRCASCAVISSSAWKHPRARWLPRVTGPEDQCNEAIGGLTTSTGEVAVAGS
jgi:hypothetical protein